MPVCDMCGREVDDRDRFCHGCVAPLGSAPQKEVPAQPPIPVLAPALPAPLGEEELRVKAEKKVKSRMVLLRHAGVYLIMNLFFVAIWALSGAGYPWFLWAMTAWGLGLALHALSYFLGSRTEAVMHQLVNKEMEKLGGYRR